MTDVFKWRECTWVLGGVQICHPIHEIQNVTVTITPCPGKWVEKYEHYEKIMILQMRVLVLNCCPSVRDYTFFFNMDLTRRSIEEHETLG